MAESTIFQYEFLRHHPAVAELPVVAAAHAHLLAVAPRAGEKPLRDAEVAAHPVPVIAVVERREAR